MRQRQLGQTGLRVSVIGFGGVPVNRVDYARAERTLHAAFDAGINIVDTARSYGDSEEKIGRALQSWESSDEIILATKSQKRDASGMAEAIDESLAALRTDFIHLYQIHDLREGELEQVEGPGGALNALCAAQEDGKIGHIGLSGHRPRVLMPAMHRASLPLAVVQIPLNIVDYPLFRENVPAALEQDLGILVMKPLCGGILKTMPEALRFVLSHPVSSVLVGMDCTKEVRENASIGCEPVDFSKSDREELQRQADELGSSFCRRCEYCMPCPAGLQIPDILRFERYFSSYFTEEWAQEQYRQLDYSVDDCIDCGRCEELCPYGLPVRQYLDTAHRHLTE